ncbi:MAG: glutamine synthetase type III, partial [Verrucomicrobiota bacterium]|nr:glutamine synthetase type III [Verrucomicrobiota bacterium]
KETYKTLIAIEAGTAAKIAKTMIVPAAVTAIAEYSVVPAVAGLAGEMSSLLERVVSGVAALEAAGEPAGQIAAMNELRVAVDALEALVPADLWPMPTYAEMLFI